MAYVLRDKSGNITTVFAGPQKGLKTEKVADNDRDLVAFIEGATQTITPEAIVEALAAKDSGDMSKYDALKSRLNAR